MNRDEGEDPVDSEEIDEEGDDSMTDTVVMSDGDDTDNVGDSSVEINVEQLIADFERDCGASSARKKEIRRRLEEIAEARAMEDTFAFDFDDD